jgi:hypothetical protein
MKYQLEIYKNDNKNFLKSGKLSKKALSTKGSFYIVSTDENTDTHIKEFKKSMEHYTNIHTGYMDSLLHLQDKEGNKYVAYWSFNNITCGFSNLLKHLN